MIARRRFLTLAAAAGGLAFGRPADATGGLDPELGTPPPLVGVQPDAGNPAIRVLLASRVDPQRVTTTGSAGFAYAGKTYRGGFSIVDGPDRVPALVATLPLDAYLYGVVPLEIGRRWPDGALQAQAIVARTYALGHRLRNRPYDVVANTADQVWGGTAAESADTNAAVDATEGQFVTYSGGLASVFYSSSCGGHTADAAGLWGGVAIPYLRGVADPYCLSSSPDAYWSATITVGTLVSALGARALALGPLREISLADPAADERRALRLTGTSGAAEFASGTVRAAVGPRALRSALWRSLSVAGDPAQAATVLRIEGSGLGHGVGLCQWGARVMAQQGWSPYEIIGFYFPGTLITHV
ncbi:MAG: SpoIID/LytB domain-containing protein [Vulcanimicrobiaceae bacterium]